METIFNQVDITKTNFALSNKFKFMDNKQSFLPVTALDFPLLT